MNKPSCNSLKLKENTFDSEVQELPPLPFEAIQLWADSTVIKLRLLLQTSTFGIVHYSIECKLDLDSEWGKQWRDKVDLILFGTNKPQSLRNPLRLYPRYMAPTGRLRWLENKMPLPQWWKTDISFTVWLDIWPFKAFKLKRMSVFLLS